MSFDYYYGSTEAEQFTFYRIPRVLIKDKRFKKLSNDAKILYGLMLDRMALSMKNGWLDKDGRVYIYYVMDDIMEDLGCSKPTCVKILAELDSKKGIGLIEKKKQGRGKPDIIYVKNFVKSDTEEEFCMENNGESIPVSEVKNFNFKESNNLTSRSKEIEPLEVKKLYPNYTNNNYTNMNYNNPINQSENAAVEDPVGYVPMQKPDGIDKMDNVNTYMELIRENLEYDFHMKYDDAEDKKLFEEIYEIICDVVCVPRKTIRVGKEDYPYELVKNRFLKLTSSHVDYVRWQMKETTTKITNIKSYMITTLYNAPSTINHFYQQKVQCDMYGGYG